MATKKEPTSGLRKLLEDQLADIYYAEKQLVKALPKMVKAATNEELRAAFDGHLEETKGQVERLEQVFELLELPAKAKTCPAILGILQECNELMEEYADDEALDAALVDGAKKVEHYEIATYTSLCAWAEQLGLEDVAGLLKENLEEEQAADEKLTGIGEEVMSEAAGSEEPVGADEGDRGSSRVKGSAKGKDMSAKSASNGAARKSSASNGKR
jgi:ferritin-like metal-binding protein YciE